jgi:fructose-bisphosphate aldolase, class II
MNPLATSNFVRRAWELGLVVPEFNVPYLPMMDPIIRALRDTKCFGLVGVARLEWTKFEAKSLLAVYNEYQRVRDER